MKFYLLSSNTWWKIMRITFSQLLITLLISSISFAKNLKAQDVLNRTVNVAVNNTSLETALKKLEKNASIKFVYSKNIVKTDQKITFAAADQQLRQVLEKLLVERGIAYHVINDHIVLNVTPQYEELKKLAAEKQALIDAAINVYTVKGKVSDNTGFGLPGVNVKLKGSTTAVATDSNGNYSISIPDGTGTLEFSFIGFDPKEVPIAGQTVINVTLTENNKQLNEVVVIGYGTQKRGNVTGAQSTLKGDNLDERAITRVDQALVGQLAGVTVKQTTGVPGKAFSIQVRGSGSISAGNEPLYVIDGFPLTPNSSNTGNGSFSTGNPLDNINPNDIESVEILKDAAAAAIYGSRASNGVVLITTKRGKPGAPKINFNAYGGFNQAAKKLQMMNGDQWIENATEVINAQYLAKFPTASITDNEATRIARNGGASDANLILDPRWAIPGHPGLAFIDWQDAIERKGVMQNYQISASGATDAVNYFVSGNYANQEGFVINVGYKAYSLRANVEVNLTKKLKFGLNVTPTYSITQDPTPGIEGQNSIFHQALSFAPVQEESSGLLPNIGSNGQYSYSSTTNSPYGKLIYNQGLTKRFRTLGTLYGEYEIIKNLRFRSSVNLDNTDNNASAYTPYTTTGTLAGRTFNGTNVLTAATSGSYNSYRRQTFVNENTLTYSTIIAKDHSINLLGGISYNFDKLDRSTLASNGGYTSAVIQTLNAAAAVTGNTTSTQSVLESYFARAQYGFKDKYLLSASIRTDGSSRFGVNNQFGVFPSASVAWRITQESFMKKVTAVSDMKLRASYGVNGNYNLPNDYASIPTIGSAGYVFGTTPAAAIGQFPNVLPNPDLKWEKSQTYDFGLDFGFLNNRITGSFDYYNKLNTDLLLNVPVAETTGFASYLTNVGSVRNIGQELELTTRNTVGKFQWSTTINVTHNGNKVEALGPGQSQIIIPNGNNVSDAILRVGSPLYSIYVLKTIGFLTAADIANGVARYGAETEGDLKYEDLNGDKTITEADKQIVGHPNPDYTFGITNNFKYRNFDLTVLVQGQQGGTIFSELGRAITRPGQGRSDNHPASFVNRWRSPTDQGDGRFGKSYSLYYSPITSATDMVYSTDYIRVRNITLGYNLKSVIKTPVVQGARIYVTLENFFGGDKYTNGLNPEASNTSSSSNSAFPNSGDYGGLPLAKSLIFGMNFTF
jgi:TonB-linked SusC/RagA family outer membrane protein